VPSRCPVGFSSTYLDTDSGLLYFGHRYYSPDLGRWLCRDPLGEKGGANLYAHCQNDPVNAADPLGLKFVLYPFLIDGGRQKQDEAKALFWKAIDYLERASLVLGEKIEKLRGDERNVVNLYLVPTYSRDMNKWHEPRTASNQDPFEGLIKWSPWFEMMVHSRIVDGKLEVRPGRREFTNAAEVLGHEIGHAYRFFYERESYRSNHQTRDEWDNTEERAVIDEWENVFRKARGAHPRLSHRCRAIPAPAAPWMADESVSPAEYNEGL
jgi:RHS repeat-associated protein